MIRDDIWRHSFFDGQEHLNPLTGYDERNIEWFHKTIMPKWMQLKDVGMWDAHSKVLDVGCAYGYYTKEYAKLLKPPGDILGIDYSGLRVESAIGLNLSFESEVKPKYKVIDLAVECEYLPADTFDIAVTSAVFQHIDPDKREIGFKHIAQALKPGGKFVLFDSITFTDQLWDGFFSKLSLSFLDSLWKKNIFTKSSYPITNVGEGLPGEVVSMIILEKPS